MSKIKFRFCLLLSLVLAACIVCGTCLLAFADGAANEVDANGWNTMVTRGGEYADGGHRTDENYYSTYTDLQDGDQITYGGTLQSKKVDYLVRTTPIRFDIAAKGEGSVTWTLSADNAENERVTVYSGTMNIGGSALAAQQGIDMGGRQIPVVPEGQPLSIAFEGFHEYGGRVWYDIGNGFVELGVSGGGNFANAGQPETFYLTVTVNGSGVEEVSVKAGEGDLFTTCLQDWSWSGVDPDFTIKAFAKGAIRTANVFDGSTTIWEYLAFKSMKFQFPFNKTGMLPTHM